MIHELVVSKLEVMGMKRCVKFHCPDLSRYNYTFILFGGFNGEDDFRSFIKKPFHIYLL